MVESHFRWDPQGQPKHQYCDAFLEMKAISLGIFWMHPSQCVWWHSVSSFSICSAFWMHLLLSAAERQSWESSSRANGNASFPRLNVVYSIQPVNPWKRGGLEAYWSGLSTKYVSGSKMWIYVVWGQTVSLQLELGRNAALSSSQHGSSLVFHLNDGPHSLRLPRSFFVSRCASLCLSAWQRLRATL